MGPTLDLGNLLVHLRADDQIMRQVEGTLNNVSRKLDAFGRTMTTRVTLPLVALGTLGVKAFASFDDAMTKSLAIMQGITPEIRKQMSNVAIELSKVSTTSATELAKAYFYLASAGLDARQSMQALGVVEKFAIAGTFDLSQATWLLAGSQGALGLRSKNAAENMKSLAYVGDVLTKANTLANATIQQFAAALGNEAGASMKNWNIQLEEGVAILAAYADQMVVGEEAGSSFGRLIRMVTKAYQSETAAWKAANLELFDEKGFFRLTGLIEDMSNKFANLTPQAKAATLAQLGFVARTQQVILPLLGASDRIKEYTKSLRDASGYMSNVAEKNIKSFSAQMRIVWNNVKVLGIEIGSILAPTIEQFGKTIKNITEFFSTLSQRTKELIVRIAGYAAAIGPAALAIGMFVKVLASLSAIMAVVLSPLGLLAGALIYLGASSKGVSKGIESVTNSIQGLFNKIKNWSSQDIANLQLYINLVGVELGRLKGYFQSFVSYLQDDFNGASQVAWKIFLSGLELAGKTAIDLALRVGKGIWEGVKRGIFGEVTQEVKDVALQAYKAGGGTLIEKKKLIGGFGQNAIYSRTYEPADEVLYQQYIDDVLRVDRERFKASVFEGFGDMLSTYSNQFVKAVDNINKTASKTEHGKTFVENIQAVNDYADAQKDALKQQHDLMQFWNSPWGQKFTNTIKEGARSVADYFGLIQNSVKELNQPTGTMDNNLIGIPDATNVRDVLVAYQSMYSQMGRMSDASYESQKKLLQAMADEYMVITNDVETVTLWQEEQLRQLQIEYDKQTGGFWKGFKAGASEMANELTSVGELGANVAMTLRDSFADFAVDAVKNIRSVGDGLRAIALQLAEIGIRFGAQHLFQFGLNALGLVGGTPAAGTATGATDITSGIPGVAYAAEGGIAWKPQMTMIAESGPEAVVPLSKVGSPLSLLAGGKTDDLLQTLIHEVRQLSNRPNIITDYRPGVDQVIQKSVRTRSNFGRELAGGR